MSKYGSLIPFPLNAIKQLIGAKICAPDNSIATAAMTTNDKAFTLPTVRSSSSNFGNMSASLTKKSSYQNNTHADNMSSSLTEADEKCAICMDDFTDPKKLDKCGHTFCTQCIDHYFTAVKPQCPCCFTIYGEIRGNQPDNGTMKHKVDPRSLPGFKHNSTGTIVITYDFPGGVQDDRHPNPGKPYHGTNRVAYLPFNDEGREILELLKKAFALRQIFTVGQSRTTGVENVVTWNDIHHKTSIHGGPDQFGYPDDTYLNRVRQELAAKGIL